MVLFLNLITESGIMQLKKKSFKKSPTIDIFKKHFEKLLAAFFLVKSSNAHTSPKLREKNLNILLFL